MSYQNPDYNINESLMDAHLLDYDMAVLSDAAKKIIREIEKKYGDALGVSEDRNAALVSQRDAVVAENQVFHDKNERLTTEVNFLKGDVLCQAVRLRDLKRELEEVRERNAELEEKDDGEIVEREVLVFLDPIPTPKKKKAPWEV